LMSFGRKKSSAEGDAHSHASHDNVFRRGSHASGHSYTDDHGFVFKSSLAAGAPMSPLRYDQAQEILNDLPTLQHIWVVTAEALVLERNIVKGPQYIKRNQHVMLDLISEDGLNQEDEWLYGRNNPDSVRPPPGAIDDDVE
jgi:hypothetical protein